MLQCCLLRASPNVKEYNRLPGVGADTGLLRSLLHIIDDDFPVRGYAIASLPNDNCRRRLAQASAEFPTGNASRYGVLAIWLERDSDAGGTFGDRGRRGGAEHTRSAQHQGCPPHVTRYTAHPRMVIDSVDDSTQISKFHKATLESQAPKLHSWKISR